MTGGSYSRNKGARAEKHLARYYTSWWPGACRAVRTGSSAAPDPGDIANVPFIVSCKDVDAKTLSWPSTWTRWWAELDAMRGDDLAALGVIVVKKAGSADPGLWRAHLRLDDLVGLRTGRVLDVAPDRTPVSLTHQDLVDLLIGAGYTRAAAS
jgi:hypothetical protein